MIDGVKLAVKPPASPAKAAAMPARCRVAALAPEVATALARALADAQDQEDRVIVFGSFHTVAAALRWLASEGWRTVQVSVHALEPFPRNAAAGDMRQA